MKMPAAIAFFLILCTGVSAKDISNVQAHDTYTVPGKGFHDSSMRVNIIYGGFIVNPWGDMMDKEDSLYEENKSAFSSGTIFDNEKVSYTERHAGLEIDYLLPATRYCQNIVFDLTGLKLGIRGRYETVKIRQYLYLYPDNEDSDSLYKSSGEILNYKNLGMGPVADFIFSPRSNSFNVLIHSYLLIGYVFDGSLSAAPALRDSAVSFNKEQYSASFNGVSLSIGIGPHFLLNRWVPVIAGVNLRYTHTKLLLDSPLHLYGNEESVSFNSFGFEFSFGVHFL